MKRKYPVLILLAGAALHAEQAASFQTPEAIAESFTDGKPLPAMEQARKIVTQFTLQKGNNTLLYRRVSAPPAKALPAEALTVAAPVRVMAADEETAEELRLSRSTHITPSTVVYPQGVTEIKWGDGNGVSKRVFAHAWLGYLPASLTVELPEWLYAFSFMHWGNGGYGEDVTLIQLPNDVRGGVLKALSQPEGHYVQVAAEDGTLVPLTEREAEALDALLAYYALNEVKLAKNHAEAVAQAELWAEAKRIHDAKPKTYEIRIWKNTPAQ